MKELASKGLIEKIWEYYAGNPIYRGLNIKKRTVRWRLMFPKSTFIWRLSTLIYFCQSFTQNPKTPRCYFLLKHYSICHKNITVIDTVLLPLLPLLPQLACSFYFSSIYHLLRWSNSAIKLNCEQTSLLLGKVLQQRVPSTQFHFRSLLLHPSSNQLSHQTTVHSVAFNSP